jgi:hypothetical protein
MERPHKKLDVWKMAMEMVLDVYRVTKTFPTNDIRLLKKRRGIK